MPLSAACRYPGRLFFKFVPKKKKKKTKAREAHLCRSRFFRDEGKIIVGGAITDDTGKMVGSCILTNFDSKCVFVKMLPF